MLAIRRYRRGSTLLQAADSGYQVDHGCDARHRIFNKAEFQQALTDWARREVYRRIQEGVTLPDRLRRSAGRLQTPQIRAVRR